MSHSNGKKEKWEFEIDQIIANMSHRHPETGYFKFKLRLVESIKVTLE